MAQIHYIHIYVTQLHNKTTVTVLYQIIDPFFYCIGKKMQIQLLLLQSDEKSKFAVSI